MSATAADQPALRGQGGERTIACFCGECAVTVSGDPIGVSYCHCSRCRTLSGAPFVACAMFEPGNAILSGETAEISTSAQVTRKRCAKCGSPMFASMGKRMVVLPLALFDKVDTHGEAWRPLHHMYYDDRVVDVPDDLPKFKGSSKHERWVPP